MLNFCSILKEERLRSYPLYRGARFPWWLPLVSRPRGAGFGRARGRGPYMGSTDEEMSGVLLPRLFAWVAP